MILNAEMWKSMLESSCGCGVHGRATGRSLTGVLTESLSEPS